MCSRASTEASAARVALAAAGLLSAVGALTHATVSPSAQLFGRVLVAPRQPGAVALTFDDGPNSTATPRLLDLLLQHGIRATFFLIGRYALAERDLVRRIHAEGHALGNHTMTHPKLPLCSRERIRHEIRNAQRAIEDTSGAAVRLFRPPHGFRTPYVLASARACGLTTVTWNVIANDWKLPTADAIAHRVSTGAARQQQRGFAANIVLHDGSQTQARSDRTHTVAAVESLLRSGDLAQASSGLLRFPTRTHFVTLDSWLAIGPPASTARFAG